MTNEPLPDEDLVRLAYAEHAHRQEERFNQIFGTTPDPSNEGA